MINRAIPDDIVEEIRLRVDIVDLVNSYIPLKKSGSGAWKALCPFHNEKTPSFNVNQNRQHFHCFGCGKNGDVFRFIMERESVDFPNAVHILAGKCGVIIPERNNYNPEEKRRAEIRSNHRERLYLINEEFASWYASLLNKNSDSPVARYLQKRGIPDDIATKFRIGATIEAWDASLKHGLANNYTESEMLESGIVIKNENGKVYDRFRNRLVFPIWNEQGRVVGFSARTIEQSTDGAKYVNSPETPVFKKGNILYALALAKPDIIKKDFIILCEGQLDVIAMHRAGYCNAVAPQGTAFTFEQAELLKRYSKKVYIAFDSDSAGIKATLRAFEILLPLDFDVKVITFPAGKDPDEIFKDNGVHGLTTMIDGACDFFDFLIKQLQIKFDSKTPAGKGKISLEVINYLEKLNNSVVREVYIRKLSESLNISCENIYRELTRVRKIKSPTVATFDDKSTEEDSADNNNLKLPASVVNAEEILFELAINYQDICSRLATELPPEKISLTPVGRALNMIIGLEINGEWANVSIAVNKMLTDSPSQNISRIFAKECSFAPVKVQQAMEQCVAEINRYYQEQKTLEIRQRLSNATTSEEKMQILHEYQQINNSK